ncbi:MAG: GAF domain-containing protein [Terriglobales bacterium]
MDKYTIFDQAGPASAVGPARQSDFWEDSARRELEAALQLLVERARYVTGASGASIALREDGQMVCRASTGRAAAEAGAEVETGSGLSAQALRTREVTRCDDAESDPRVNRESCQDLGVKSVIVLPLLREESVVGLFEVLADRVSAFQECDVAALTRLAAMAVTAVEHADAAQRALPEASEPPHDESATEAMPETIEATPPTPTAPEALALAPQNPASVSAEIARIGSCQTCGFPVSPGRKLCVDCEQAGRSAETKPAAGDASAFSQLNALGQEESWLQAHGYTLGALFIAALTLALLALKTR